MPDSQVMRGYTGVTDGDWDGFLAAMGATEVNSWLPSPDIGFRALRYGEPLLFKAHYPDNRIVGDGFFEHFPWFGYVPTKPGTRPARVGCQHTEEPAARHPRQRATSVPRGGPAYSGAGRGAGRTTGGHAQPSPCGASPTWYTLRNRSPRTTTLLPAAIQVRRFGGPSLRLSPSTRAKIAGAVTAEVRASPSRTCASSRNTNDPAPRAVACRVFQFSVRPAGSSVGSECRAEEHEKQAVGHLALPDPRLLPVDDTDRDQGHEVPDELGQHQPE